MKYAHLKFGEFEGLAKGVLVVDDDEIPVAGKKGKWLTNIPLPEGGKVNLKSDNENISLVVSAAKLFHPDQVNFDERYHIQKHSLQGEDIYYSISGNTINPRKILVTFPGVSNFDNVNYRLSAMTSLQSNLKDMLILAFQDREATYGNYMHHTENGYPLKSIAIGLISGLCSRHGIKEEDIIFYGNSKGGSIAIDYIERFQSSYFFIDIPQLDLFNYQSQNAIMRYSLGVDTRNYYNFLQYLPQINNRRVCYSFAEQDLDASCGLPMKSFSGLTVSMLKDMKHSGSAMEFVKKQFTKVIQLMNESGAIMRAPIDMKYEVKDGFLYLRRALGAFKHHDDLRKIYSEVEFTKEDESYSISLNQIFNRCIYVYWRYGFDILRHLSPGTYKMKLHVYYDFKEFVYPLNQMVTLDDKGSIIIQ
ncbi:hypothetical protein [Cedecea sp.]|jgi:hypothetical protein|uniref:hypothetical protein n=1 Tax=Cedecea sp. TaxID=1970739 RepID=UPI002F416C60